MFSSHLLGKISVSKSHIQSFSLIKKANITASAIQDIQQTKKDLFIENSEIDRNTQTYI